MINIIAFIVGIALVIGTVISLVSSVRKTPINLRGFYGGFYTIISVFGLIGGVGLFSLSFII